jgi:hypothetical protein
MGIEVEIAKAVHGEGAGASKEFRKMVASTILNRIESGRTKEFGSSLPEVLQKGYYAVSNPNTPYKEASSMKFKDKASENSFKETLQLVSGLIKGTIERDKGLFYFNQKELARLKKNPKAFDLSKVKNVGGVDNFQVFDY